MPFTAATGGQQRQTRAGSNQARTRTDAAGGTFPKPAFLAPGGYVIWTRHRGEPDLVTIIDDWFADAGFARVFVSAPEHQYGVGVHRLVTEPQPLPKGEHLFTFVR